MLHAFMDERRRSVLHAFMDERKRSMLHAFMVEFRSFMDYPEPETTKSCQTVLNPEYFTLNP